MSVSAWTTEAVAATDPAPAPLGESVAPMGQRGPRPLIQDTAPMPHIACVRRGEWAPDEGSDGDDAAWLKMCYRVTSRLERVSATCALLDLGCCTGAEARGVAVRLLHWLAAAGIRQARIGVGTSALYAQLAVLAARTGDHHSATPNAAERSAAYRVRVLSAAEGPAVVRALPVRQLPALHPAGTVTQEAVERLERYGLRTLGQVARLGEDALRRQFGGDLGMALAALAAGRDLRPLVPTPRPATLRCRLSFTSGASGAAPERVLAALAAAAELIARRLATEGRQARCLRILVSRQVGGVSAGHVRLRAPTAEARPLAQQLSDLCKTLLLALPVESANGEAVGSPDSAGADVIVSDAPAPDAAALALAAANAAVERVLVEVGDLVPLTPAQATFWQTAAQRQAAVIRVAETLARRYGGRPQLLRAQRTAPHAIVTAERYRWLPVGTVSMTDELEKLNRSPSRPRRDQMPVHPPAHPSARYQAGAGSPWAGVPHHLHWW